MNQHDANLNVGEVDASNGQTPGPGLSLDDIYYTVFRHKWLLLGFVCLGVVAVVAVLWIKPPQYESVAKVMVRYVLDTEKNPSNPESVRPLESGGVAIINSEVEILTSLDVAVMAADLVGPEKILAKVGGGSNRLAAAGMIKSGIEVKPPQTTVITVTFRHPDAELVQPVLQALLDTYTQKHREVRLGYGVLDGYYLRQRDELRDKIATTEEQLKGLKTQAKVLSSVKDAKQAYQTQIEKLTAELLGAETELAVAKAVVGDVTQAQEGTNDVESVTPPSEIIKEYTELVGHLDSLRKQERKLTVESGLRAEHPSVKAVREQILEKLGEKSALEAKYNALGSTGSFVGVGETNTLGVNISTEIANIKRLSAKVEKLGTLLSNIQAQAISVMDLEPRIAQMERQLEQEDKEYRFYLARIDQARQGEAAGAGKVVNMSIVQHPTPPGLDRKKVMKLMGAAFAGCVGCGIGLALLFDFVLDRTIRRPRDVRRHLRLPLMLSIPDSSRGGRSPASRWLRGTAKNASGAKTSGEADGANGVAPWDTGHHLRAFADGLRERLITYFEINNVTHAPKLIGVTGCSKGSGVTTLASGLAAALSKIGSGNVLLVDMNVGEGEAHSFHSGKPGCALANITEPDSQPNGPAQENLYLATSRAGVHDKLAKVMPVGFTALVTNLKASDYDYIVFDMPLVAPTSAAPRLGSYMDMVLLVLESGKTPQQLAGQAGALLAESRAKAAVVLNKYRPHVPQMLSHDT